VKEFTVRYPVTAFVVYAFVVTWVLGVPVGIALGPAEAHNVRNQGIFEQANPANPFSEYSAVHVRYCTGDIHLGDRDATYTIHDDKGESRQFKIHHRGQVNAILACLAPTNLSSDLRQQCRRIVVLPVRKDMHHVRDVLNVCRRIAAHDQEVRFLAGCDRANAIVDAEKRRSLPRRNSDRVERCESGLDEQRNGVV
jgi:hypothetical protein